MIPTKDQGPTTTFPLALIFLRLGATAFGGPAAHIAMMQREFVERRGWVTRERFADMLGAVNLIPGPNSTELAISIGAELAGTRGIVVAGVSFILPAFSIVLTLAWLYASYGTLPDVAALLAGVKPVALAIIAQAIWKLAGAVARPVMLILALLVATAAIAGVHELPLLLGSGLVAAVIARRGGSSEDAAGNAVRREKKPKRLWFYGGGLLAGVLGAPTAGSIFLYFLYLGSVLYGSGYVLVAFLRSDLVAPGSLEWLTERQLLDAVAVGQVTPGPLFTTATFVGYILGGLPGGITATIGIFLPSFIFILLTHRWIARLRSRPVTAAFLDGVNAGALALIAVALVTLGRSALVDPLSWGIAVVSLAILIATRVNPTWLIAAGAVVGWMVSG